MQQNVCMDKPEINSHSLPLAGENDQEVWQRFKMGDRQAFSQIYTLYVRVLHTYGLKITPNRERVQDAIQDLFIELWKNRETIGHTTSIRFYLYTCLRRKITRHLVGEARFVSAEQLAETESSATEPHESHLIENQASDQQRILLQKAMDKLTQRQREALFLKYYECLSNVEIAQLMAIHEQSVYNLVHQGLSLLKKHVPIDILIFFFLLFSLKP